MRYALIASLAAAALALAGCASSRSQAPNEQAASAPATPLPPAVAEQISPAHPYCMFIPKAGQLRECDQYAFGRCTAWSQECHTPGWMTAPGELGTGGTSGASGPPW